MTKSLVSTHFPLLKIKIILGPLLTPLQTFETETMIDTGFEGGITIPRGMINASIPFINFGQWTLADGTEIAAPVYLGYVQIGDFKPVPTLVISLGIRSLLGLEVIKNFQFVFDHGKEIIVSE